MNQRLGSDQRPCPHCEGSMIYMPKLVISQGTGKPATREGTTSTPYYASGWQCIRNNDHIVWDGPAGSIRFPVVCKTCGQGINAWVLPDPEIGQVMWTCPECKAEHEQDLGGNIAALAYLVGGR